MDTAVSGPGGEQPSDKQVAELLAHPRNTDRVWQAYQLCEAQLANSPDDAQLLMHAAEALVSYVRQKTDANSLRPDGTTSDTPEYRAIWKTHGARALQLLDKLPKSWTDDGKYALLHAEAFMYTSASKGIMKAAVKGDAGTFKKNVNRLIDSHRTYGHGVGHIFMGAFYLGAPWPVYNVKKSWEHFSQAREIEPLSQRNNYYCGVVSYVQQRYDDAERYFRQALQPEAKLTHEDKDISKFFRDSAQAGLAQLAGHGQS